MSASADALMKIFGTQPVTCKTCAHALPSQRFPMMVYYPVKFKPVNDYHSCDAHKPKGKK